jgi:hypothetical protein
MSVGAGTRSRVELRNGRALITALLGLIMAIPGTAQQATIQGEIRDPTLAAIPAAEVTATNVNEQTTVTGRTNEAGFFSISGLVPGRTGSMCRLPVLPRFGKRA